MTMDLKPIVLGIVVFSLSLAGCATVETAGRTEEGPCLTVAEARGMVEPGGDGLTVSFWVPPGYTWEWGEVATQAKPVAVQLPMGFTGMGEGGDLRTRLLFYRSDVTPDESNRYSVTIRLPGWRFTEGKATLTLYHGEQWVGCPSNAAPVALSRALVT